METGPFNAVWNLIDKLHWFDHHDDLRLLLFFPSRCQWPGWMLARAGRSYFFTQSAYFIDFKLTNIYSKGEKKRKKNKLNVKPNYQIRKSFIWIKHEMTVFMRQFPNPLIFFFILFTSIFQFASFSVCEYGRFFLLLLMLCEKDFITLSTQFTIHNPQLQFDKLMLEVLELNLVFIQYSQV